MDESVLKSTVERTGPTQQVVKGEIEWPEVKSKLDQTFKELSKEVRLKGFRKGKVPRSLLDKMMGKRVRAEVSNQLAREAVADAIGKHKLRVVTPPGEWDISTEGIKKEEPLKFEVALEVLPLIEPKDYFGIEVEKQPVEVTDEEVDTFIERQREQLTQMKAIEDRTDIRPGDVVACEVLGKVGDEPIDLGNTTVEIPTEEEKEKGEVTEPLPGLAEALEGKDTSDGDVEIELELGEDAPETYRNKKARLLVTFTGLKQPIVPDLDDEFARDTDLADTLDELKDVVRERLHAAYEDRADQEAKDQLLDKVCEKNPIELTDRVIEDETNRLRQRLSSSMGIDMRAMGEHGKALDDTLRKQAKKDVHRALLLDAIADKEDVTVSDEELDEHLSEMAEARNTNLPRLKAELQRQGALESVRMSLRESKTVDLLLEQSHATQDSDKAETKDSEKKEAEDTDEEEADKEDKA
jgi:trigger factor